MTQREIARLFAYTDWANHLVLNACTALTENDLYFDFKTGHHSIHGTLAHMMAAEWVWLSRWQGQPYKRLAEIEGPLLIKRASLAELQASWNELEVQRNAIIASRSDGSLSDPIAYTNSAGEQFSQPLIEQMQHVVNHATYHRGQISGFLRALGTKPPTTDMIHFFRTVG